MIRNENSIDRVIRAVLGVGILALLFVGPKTMWGLLGLIPLATAIVGVCPVYRLFGISTEHKDKPTGGSKPLGAA